MGKTFKGGIHPPENKNSTEGLFIENLPESEKLTIFLNQHFGKPAPHLVKQLLIVLRRENNPIRRRKHGEAVRSVFV